MKKYWEQKEIVNKNYILERIGPDFIDYRRKYFYEGPSINDAPENQIYNRKLGRSIKETVEKKILGRQKKLDDKTKIFRESGEIHQWMYDKYSLKCLLEQIGFRLVEKVSAYESRNINWQKYSFLDIENDLARKPDSLFMEALK